MQQTKLFTKNYKITMKSLLTKFLLLLAFFTSSMADEIRMAYLELNESSKNNYAVKLKTPMKKSFAIPLQVAFDKTCKESNKKTTLVNKALLHTWSLTCKNNLVGSKIHVDGLNYANTDMLLQLKLLNKKTQTIIITPQESSYEIPTELSSLHVVKTYTYLGIEHILEGFDHLLFVLALLLIVRNIKTLIWTITAFTLAHSITLAGSSLGYLALPSAPVEAIIALSIMFLAMEVIHQGRGIEGMASRFPWVVSFTFGLLHGFGFAGALAEIGLPEQSVPLALLFFNVGVEIGQLMFVSVVLVIGFVLRKIIFDSLLNKSKIVLVYAIGGLSSFWFIERVSGF